MSFFDPSKVPFRGFKSALSGLALSAGEWLLADNVRLGDRTLRNRWGLSRAGSVPVRIGEGATASLGSTAYPVGAKAVRANGSVFGLSAWQTTGGPSGTWLVKTDLSVGSHAIKNAASGAYGDTTSFGTSTYTPVDFFTQKDPRDGLEYVVVVGDTGSGVYDPTNDTFAVIADVSAPEDTSGFSTKPTFPVFFTVKDASTTAHTNSDADWAVADVGASTTENYLTYTRAAAAASDATAQTVFSAAIDLSSSRQLCFLYDSATIDFWERVKIQIQEGAGSPTTVWDPSASNYRPEYVPVGDLATETKQIVAFGLDHIASASRNAVDTIILTYLGAVAPTTAVVANVYLIAGSGKVLGNSYHAVTYFDPATRVESQPIFPKVMPELVKNLGGPTLNNLRIPFQGPTFDENGNPVTGGLFYTYSVGYQNTSSATQVSKVNIYRLDPGDPDPSRYYYVTTETITAYAGSWAFSSGTALSILTYSDTTVSSSRNRKVTAPFPGCKAMPTRCFAGISLGERSVMARYHGSGAYNSPSFSELWISEAGNPWRYYQAPYRGDPLSGGMLQTSGEVIYGLATTGGEGYGLQRLWVFTDKNLYSSYGPAVQDLLSLGLVAEHGTKYRDSIATYKGSLFWVDRNQDVIRLRGGITNLSRHVIDDQFSTLLPASPFLINNSQGHKVSAVYFKNTYRCSVDTAGTDLASTMSKTKTPIYWDDFGVWTRDVYGASRTAQYMFEADGKLYGWSTNRYLYVHDDGSTTTDDSTAFAMSLTTGTIHVDFEQGVEVTRCWVLMDDATSGTAAWTATYLPDASTRGSGSKSVDVSGSYVLRELRATGGTGKGSGVTASIAFVFTVPGGTRVYGISGEFHPVPLTPTAV